MPFGNNSESGSNESEQQALEAKLDESALQEVPSEVERPAVQVESNDVVFVAQEDFEGSINREPFKFTKGVRYQVTRDQANTWVQAEKGYILE